MNFNMKTIRIPVFLLPLALAATTAFAAKPQPDQTSRLPNVLFIVSDDHGWGDLPSNWNKTVVRLPSLVELAGKGVLF